MGIFDCNLIKRYTALVFLHRPMGMLGKHEEIYMRVPTMFMVLTILVLMFAAMSVRSTGEQEVQRPIKMRQWNEETKVWLARSCVGEIGFGSPARPHEANEECVAIAWIYAKRVKAIRWPLKKVIRKYSAAVKARSTHARPWVLGLRGDAKRPHGWPKNLRWSVHKPLWEQKLLVLDRWANGELPDPLPEANHYGGGMDARYAEYIMKWRRVKTPDYYKNRFYDSTGGIRVGKYGRLIPSNRPL